MSTIPTIAATILEQLGGQKIFAMAFERALYDASGTVTLHVAKSLRRMARDKISHVTVGLHAPSDTYVVTFWNKRGTNVVESVDFVTADCLRTLVEGRTGLALSLGTCNAAAE